MTASRHLRTVFEVGAIGTLPDRVLLERFLAGRGDEDSAAAFAALVERHAPMVLSVCRNTLGHAEDAEDAAQATFLVLAKRAASIRRAESLASWLFGVALRVARKARAGAARRRAVEQEGAAMRADSSGPLESHDDLHEAIGRLPERLRAPIVLCHLEGLTNEQAAGRLGLPVRTVQRRLAQGRDRLRDRLAGLSLAPAVEPVSEAWIEATARAAAGLAAGGEVGAVASAPVAAKVKGAMTMILASRLTAIAAIAGAVVLAGFGALLAARPQEAPAPKVDATAPPAAAGVGPWIRGLVVDEQGRPVAGARVSVLWAPAPEPVTTAADGTFALPAVGPKGFQRGIVATADDGARQGIARFVAMSGGREPRNPVRVVLRPGRDLTATVVDGRGLPVAEASVFALDRYFPVASGRTDDRGIAVLRVPAEANVQWIAGFKPGVGFDSFNQDPNGVMNVWMRPPRTVGLALEGGRTVRIRVVDRAGRPVPGVELAPSDIWKEGPSGGLYIEGGAFKARTDADGIATFDWLPAALHGPVTFELVESSMGLETAPTFDPDHPVAELTARLVRPARVSGRVRLPDGSPAPGILVEAANGFGLWPGSRQVKTAADGSYSLDLPPEQPYLIGVVDDRWAAPSLGVVVREDTPHEGLDLKLSPGCVIRGRVSAPDGGKARPGVTIHLVEKGPDVPPGTFADQSEPRAARLQRVVETDDDGRYAFRVGPGDYTLWSTAVSRPLREQQEIKVLPDTREIRRDLTMEPEDLSARIAGVVRAGGPDGPPVAGARLIVVSTQDRWLDAFGEADDHGRFEMPFPPGKVAVYARNPDGSQAGTTVVDATGGREIGVVVRPAATARGRVVDEAGKPRASMNVSYLCTIFFEAGRDPACPIQVVRTDSEGRFTAPGLPVGLKCYFSAYSPDPTKSRSCQVDVDDARPIDLPPLVVDRPQPSRPGPR